MTAIANLASQEITTIYSADTLQWYCREPVHTEPVIIHKESFHVTDLGAQLKPVIERWKADESLRKCGKCGKVAPPM